MWVFTNKTILNNNIPKQKPASKTLRLKEEIILCSFVPLCLGGYIISYTFKNISQKFEINNQKIYGGPSIDNEKLRIILIL